MDDLGKPSALKGEFTKDTFRNRLMIKLQKEGLIWNAAYRVCDFLEAEFQTRKEERDAQMVVDLEKVYKIGQTFEAAKYKWQYLPLVKEFEKIRSKYTKEVA